MRKLLILACMLPIFTQAQVSKSDFETLITDIIKLYDHELPIHQRRVDIDWESDVENASVSLKRGKVNFIFHGGFVRHFDLSADAMALITCHEIGHIIGGHPKVMPTQKYTSEGQSDYFATKTCLKEYFRSKHSDAYILDGISDAVIAKCRGDEICLRGLAAIRDASVIYKENTHIDHSSKHVSNYTIFNGYPQGQCRVDTLKAGLFNESRPNCWFREFQSDRYEYQSDYEYEEAQGVADITEVTKTYFGCHIRTAYPNYWAGSYFNPLSESELMMNGINVVGACPYKTGESLSGSISLFRGKLYLNLNPTDK